MEAEAAAALGKTRRDALTPLQQAAHKPSWNETIRHGVFRGPGRVEEHIPLLRDFTTYGQPPMARYAAIRALGKLGGERTLPQLIVETLTALLDEEHFRTRMAVLDALESLHSPKTLPALERLRARDLDGRVQRRVEEVIEAIRSERRQTDEVQQLRDDFQALREANSCSTASIASKRSRPRVATHDAELAVQPPPGCMQHPMAHLALAGEPQHGLALGTTVKYPPGFAHYAYADPQAVQGGVLTLSSPGSFDKLNPFSLKGRARCC